MTSVERVMEYAKLKPEAPLETPETKPPKGWPGNGSVSLRKMSLRYSDESPLVLTNVSCEIESKEKVTNSTCFKKKFRFEKDVKTTWFS